jgi:hypothetical protein
MRRRSKARSLARLLAAMLVSIGVTACGSAGEKAISTSPASLGAAVTDSTSMTTASNGGPSSLTTTPSGSHHIDSNDGDNDPNSDDDSAILDYGHAASEPEKHAITALVARYYAAAAADDGASACTLIYGIVVETIPESYSLSPELAGGTCAAVMSNVFKQRHKQLAAEAAALKVTEVRVEGKKGLALMYFGATPESHIYVHREDGAWKVESLFAAGMP